jgi:lysophospholipase L1-like esterase
MKAILCYGDSNTWGYIPGSGERYAPNIRWPGVLQQTLGSGYKIIEEGLSGRTTVWDDPIEEFRNGKDYLVPCLKSHAPLDLVILMLGSNDLKARFSAPAFNIAMGVGVLVDIIQKSETGVGGEAPQVLLIAPPPINPVPGSDVDEDLAGGTAKSLKFSQFYRGVADDSGCAFFDSSQVISPSPVDGLHLEPKAHKALGLKIAEIVSRLID